MIQQDSWSDKLLNLKQQCLIINLLQDYLSDDDCICDEAQIKNGTCRACIVEKELGKIYKSKQDSWSNDKNLKKG